MSSNLGINKTTTVSIKKTKRYQFTTIKNWIDIAGKTCLSHFLKFGPIYSKKEACIVAHVKARKKKQEKAQNRQEIQ